jgi:hypothetical protein
MKTSQAENENMKLYIMTHSLTFIKHPFPAMAVISATMASTSSLNERPLG